MNKTCDMRKDQSSISNDNRKRSQEAIARRKVSKKKKKLAKRKLLPSLLVAEKTKSKLLENDLRKAEASVKRLQKIQVNQSCCLSSVSQGLKIRMKMSQHLSGLLPTTSHLSSDTVDVREYIVGQGTFGVVKLSFLKNLKIECAIKIGKTKQFNAELECRILQICQGSIYFPVVFGTFDNKLVMELISNSGEVKTIYSERKVNKVTQNVWIQVCRDLSEALFFFHSKNLLHNDLKSNNVLLLSDGTSKILPKVIDMGKVTTRSEPHRYRLNEKQKKRYNEKYTYLAPELRNQFDSRTSILTDIFSLGVIFKFVADPDNKFLSSLSKQMMSDNPSRRPNTSAVLRNFKKLS